MSHHPARRKWIPLLALPLLAIGWGVTGRTEDTPKPPPKPTFPPEQVRFFEKEVLPILEKNCLRCHGKGKKLKGGLNLTSRAAVLKGGDLGPAVSLKEPDKSNLLEAIHYKGDLLMPPDGQLPEKEIATLTRWVKAGLPWTPGADVVVTEPKGFRLTDEQRNYWAYRPVTRPAVPEVRSRAWCRTPVDTFIAAGLEAARLSSSGPASPETLIRRLYYDLIGLPPSPDEVDAFVRDESPDAYENLVDRLLASPQYGEKWGRHWLDLVRYAETNGYERDGPKPNAWRYRDYVIASFNDDKPYPQFIREQLAGDEIPGRTRDSIIATGYYRLGIWQDEPVDVLQSYYNELDDIVVTTSQAFLGTTVGCARCHDHKKDPIPQTDYYRFLAFFHDIEPYSKTRNVTSPFNQTDITDEALQAAYREKAAEVAKEKEAIAKEMHAIEQAAIVRMPAADQRATEGPQRKRVLREKLDKFLKDGERRQYEALKRRLAAVRAVKFPPREFALSVNQCRVHPPQAHVLVRGSARAKGEPVEPGFPVVLHEGKAMIPPPPDGAKTAGRRTVLADWIASPDNPLTARVMVNRLWQHHFGRGLVPTPNDFGQLGEKPTHPALLDWLASEFMAGGWQVKRIHRLLLLSNTYRMSSRAHAEGLEKDPANRLFWRFNMRRLTAEEVRDSVLLMSGELNPKMGGPSIYPVIPAEVLAGQSQPGKGWGRSPPEEAARRSVYVHLKRSLLVPILENHDVADTDSSCAARYTTIVPTQALGMLNGDFINEQARAFAQRLRRERPGDLAAQIRRAIRLTTGRQPEDKEVAADVAFVRELGTEEKLDEEQALACYCLLAVNTNEFAYLD